MTKIKICGITNIEDASLSVQFGADLLGFNFYRGSKRFVEPEIAAEIIQKLGASVLSVGIFVDETIENILNTVSICGLYAVQLHGNETPEFVAELAEKTDTKIIKAFRVDTDLDLNELQKFPVDSILLDSKATGDFGGSGNTFDWNIAAKIGKQVKHLYLAGGLSPENVAEAIREVRPYAVDVCSRIESVPGKKDPIKLERFIEEVKTNDKF